LSLYTYYNKTIIITIAPLSRRYGNISLGGKEYTKYVNEHYEKHLQNCEYYNCSNCQKYSIKHIWNINDKFHCDQCGANGKNDIVYCVCSNCHYRYNIDDYDTIGTCPQCGSDTTHRPKFHPCACNRYIKVLSLNNDRTNCVNCGHKIDICIPQFHKCNNCLTEWSRKDEMVNDIIKWYDRIEKYNHRFPDYDIIYVNMPHSR